MGHIAGTIATVISAALGFFWLIDISFGTWQKKQVLTTSWEVGIWSVTTSSVNLLSFVPSSFKPGFIEPFEKFLDEIGNGQKSIVEQRNKWCSAEVASAIATATDSGCDVWGWLYIGGWTMGLLGIFASIFFFLGSGFSFYYWHKEAREDPRMWARIFLCVAPATVCLGLLMYTFMTWGFSDWNPTRLGSTHNAFSYGFLFAWVLAVLSWLPLVLHEVFAGKAWIEQHNEAAAEFRHEQREAAMDAAYGGGGGYNNYGAMGPPMQQQGAW